MKKMYETIWVRNAGVEDIRELMEGVGTKIGSVHFLKRGDGVLRKMTYRLHVKDPTTAPKPKGGTNRGVVDTKNKQMTVLDTNKVVYDTMGEVKGRGAYRTVPLEKVVQITANGVRYIIKAN